MIKCGPRESLQTKFQDALLWQIKSEKTTNSFFPPLFYHLEATLLVGTVGKYSVNLTK